MPSLTHDDDEEDSRDLDVEEIHNNHVGDLEVFVAQQDMDRELPFSVCVRTTRMMKVRKKNWMRMDSWRKKIKSLPI